MSTPMPQGLGNNQPFYMMDSFLNDIETDDLEGTDRDANSLGNSNRGGDNKKKEGYNRRLSKMKGTAYILECQEKEERERDEE